MIGADLEYFNSEDDEENGHIYLNSIGELCTTFTLFQLLLDTCKIDNVPVQFMVFSYCDSWNTANKIFAFCMFV